MKVVILGNGICGVTCARHLRKRSDCEITIVSDESDEFFSRTALMYIYMGHMRERDTRPYESWFWEKNRLNRVRARIERIDFQAKKLYTTTGDQIGYDKLVLAVGSKSNRFGWPGQDLDGVHGLYHLQDLAAMERHSSTLIQSNNRAVIVGGGLIGIEMAEMFHSRNIPVTFLVREPSFWGNILPAEESAMVNRHIETHHIDLRLGTGLKEILDNGKDQCKAVITDKGEEISCGFVGLTAGVSPNIEFLKHSGLEINKGILVDEYLQTNIPDVYAGGDCAEIRQPNPGRKAIEAVWYTGRMMGETLAHNIMLGHSSLATEDGGHASRQKLASPMPFPLPYNPGIWFNSAKFFDIEYQVYGDIQARRPETQSTLYWEHSEGKKSIRINYDRTSGSVLGFNLMGVRYRQEVCERWIREGAHIETVLQQVGLANFDPEFFRQHEPELVATYNLQAGKNLSLKQKRGLSAVLEFLK